MHEGHGDRLRFRCGLLRPRLVVPVHPSIGALCQFLPGHGRRVSVGPGVIAGSSVPDVLEQGDAEAWWIQVSVVPPLESRAGIQAVAIEDRFAWLGDDRELHPFGGCVAEVGVIVPVSPIALVAGHVGRNDVGANLGDRA